MQPATFIVDFYKFKYGIIKSHNIFRAVRAHTLKKEFDRFIFAVFRNRTDIIVMNIKNFPTDIRPFGTVRLFLPNPFSRYSLCKYYLSFLKSY